MQSIVSYQTIVALFKQVFWSTKLVIFLILLTIDRHIIQFIMNAIVEVFKIMYCVFYCILNKLKLNR